MAIAPVLLMSRDYKIAAELFPNERIIIHEKRILENLKIVGINVSAEFQAQYKLEERRVFPKDRDDAFAAAFEKYKFAGGLQQGGYYWLPREEYYDFTQPVRLLPKSDDS